jgi:hypothetical protein
VSYSRAATFNGKSGDPVPVIKEISLTCPFECWLESSCDSKIGSLNCVNRLETNMGNNVYTNRSFHAE